MSEFREFLAEKKDISKEVIKLLKTAKDGVMTINDKGIMVNFTDYDDGVFVGMDQFDEDVEEDSLKGYELDE
jgi:hypothetical protein